MTIWKCTSNITSPMCLYCFELDFIHKTVSFNVVLDLQMNCEDGVNCGILLWGQRSFGLWLMGTGRWKMSVGADTYNMNTDFNVFHCTDTGICPVPWWAGSGHQGARKLLQWNKWKFSVDLLPWSGVLESHINRRAGTRNKMGWYGQGLIRQV